jgi:hypothetical protein
MANEEQVLAIEAFFKEAFCVEKAELVTGDFKPLFHNAIKLTKHNGEIHYLAHVKPETPNSRPETYSNHQCRHEMGG